MVYALFGTNFYIGTNIKDQIRMLETRVPPDFLHRRMDDLGCGDGKITLRLKAIFQPQQLRGFDVNSALVKRARHEGIEAEVKDLNEEIPSGELAVMWGVLHHLKDSEKSLKRISQNYPMAFIREPIKNNVINGLEMGKPLIKAEIEKQVLKYFPAASTFYYNHCIFIFYIAPGYKPGTKVR
jgi:hypothetical protein